MIEIFVGFGTIISIAFLGPKGLATLSIIALRPIFLEREEIKDPKSYYKNFYRIQTNGLAIVFIMMVTLIIINQFIPVYKSKLPPVDILFVMMLPFFLMTHGVIGLVSYNREN